MLKASLSERDWLYVLTCIPGLGRKRIRNMYDTWGSFAAALEDWAMVAEQMKVPHVVAQEVQRRIAYENVCRQLERREEAGDRYLCFLDDEFPERLRQIPDPPLLFFYKGEIHHLMEPAIGVVGSRKPTPYGRACCAALVKQLVQAGAVIVSGLAYGIDGEAHQTALQAGGKTVGVMGCGIDHVYPEGHRSLYRKMEAAGLLLSEHPPGTPPVPGLFPERNRIISGLSSGVLVIEAAERSGSLITVDCALEQGRDVFAVPGPIFSPVSVGPHNLIKQGAKLVTTSADILEEWAHLFPAPNQAMPEGALSRAALDEEEQAVWEAITEEGVHMDELADLLSFDSRRKLPHTLLRLEAKGAVASLPGGFFARR